jgi:hypothetical protein
MSEAKRVWVHIRTSEYGQAMYIDGKQKALDDIMMDVPDIFRVLKETIGNEPCAVDFTYDDATDFERSMNVRDYAVVFPETIRREDITTEEV